MKRQMLSLVCGILNHGTHKSREQSDVYRGQQRGATGRMIVRGHKPQTGGINFMSLKCLLHSVVNIFNTGILYISQSLRN
jgi:hypothetical protein